MQVSWQLLGRGFRKYCRNVWIPFLASFCLFVFLVIASISLYLSPLVDALFLLLLCSSAGIASATIYQFIKKSWIKSLENFLLFLISWILLLLGVGCLYLNLMIGPSRERISDNVQPFAPVSWFLFSDDSPINQREAIETSREWVRLAPFPKSARNIKTKSTGGFFTGGYVITFEAPKEEVITWLENSPGIANAARSALPDGSSQYSIKPGGGAQYAELVLSANKQRVKITTYWS